MVKNNVQELDIDGDDIDWLLFVLALAACA
jgi:hypothetical protein